MAACIHWSTAPGTHYSWVVKADWNWELCPTLLHITTGAIEPRSSDNNLMPYPLGHAPIMGYFTELDHAGEYHSCIFVIKCWRSSVWWFLSLPVFMLSLPPDKAPMGSSPLGVRPFNCSTLSLSSLQSWHSITHVDIQAAGCNNDHFFTSPTL